jgi:uncharacterized protein
MPWGSWITCEETVNGPDVGADFTGEPNVPLQQPHGFIFEVPAGAQASREPITSAGRFPHEAVAFDPVEGILYLTEDNFGFPSGFYRYIPASNPMETGFLDNDGRLQMLAVAGQPNLVLAAGQPEGATYEVEWVDIEDPAPTFPYTPGEPAPTSNNEALVYVGDQGRFQGAAYFSRLEGSAYEDGVVYFTSTQGGGAAPPGPEAWPLSVTGYGNGTGQVWAYRIEEQVLELVFQSPGAAVLDFPDNVTTSRRGTLILCEDSAGDNFLRGLTRQGQLFDIALNRLHSVSGAPRFRGRVRGLHVQPRRLDAVREHPGVRGDVVRDLGAVGEDRCLIIEIPLFTSSPTPPSVARIDGSPCGLIPMSGALRRLAALSPIVECASARLMAPARPR